MQTSHGVRLGPLLVAAGAGAAVGFLLIHLFGDSKRFELHTAGESARAYEIDTQTGATWAVSPDSKRLIEEPPHHPVSGTVEVLPAAEAALVTSGTGSRSAGTFTGEVYNGTDEWTITGVTFFVGVENDGTAAWQQTFTDELSLGPLSGGLVHAKVFSGSDVETVFWRVSEVRGWKSHPGSTSGLAVRMKDEQTARELLSRLRDQKADAKRREEANRLLGDILALVHSDPLRKEIAAAREDYSLDLLIEQTMKANQK